MGKIGPERVERFGDMRARLSADQDAEGTLDGSFYDPNSNNFPTSKALQRRIGVGMPLPAAAFTEADRSLIARVNGLMTASSLLSLLNERLIASGAPAATAHTMEQLREEIARLAKGGDAVSSDNWAGLRKLLAAARQAGTLNKITPQLIDDFAVVFSLTAKQVIALKDIVLGDKEVSDEA